MRAAHFRLGDASLQDMIFALGWDPWPKLEQLSFVSMGLSEFLLVELRDNMMQQVNDLNLSDNRFDNYFLYALNRSTNLLDHLKSITARRTDYYFEYRVPIEWQQPFPAVRRSRRRR